MLGGQRGDGLRGHLGVVAPGTLGIAPRSPYGPVAVAGSARASSGFAGEVASRQDEDQGAAALRWIALGRVAGQGQQAERAVFLGNVAAVRMRAEHDDLV